MFKQMCRKWFESTGWKVVNAIPEKEHPDEIQKYVIIGAPHTSNMDFFMGMGVIEILKLPIRFTIKKEWMFFPIGNLMRYLGAIPIDRTQNPDNKSTSMVDEMVQILNNSTEDIMVLVTPEGTRSRRDKWRSGFYQVALQANVPILFGFIDYKNKKCGIKEVFKPTGDMEADMKHIMAFYQTTNPKFPELFSIDKRYIP